MIKIGVNKNVYLADAALNGNNIEISFKEKTDKERPKSMFANIAGDEVVDGADGMTIRMFPSLPPKKEDQTAEKKRELVQLDMNKTKGVLLHLLKAYLPASELKGIWAATFEGLPLDEASFDEKILDKAILEGVNKNMGRIFIDKIKPFLNDDTKLFRLLLVRQSKDKHYATFRNRFLEDNPMYESMEIPEEASKVGFTKYELAQGLDSDIPSDRSTADQKGTGDNTASAAGGAPMTAENVFGQG